MPVSLRDEVAMATSELGMVLLDERTGKYWQLNRSGALILDQLLEGRSLHEVVGTVSATYRVDRTAASADAKALLDLLVSSGLIVA